LNPSIQTGHRFGGGAARPPFDALIFTARATANRLSLAHRQAIPIAHEGERCSQRIAATEQPAEIGDGASQGGQRRLREELRVLGVRPSVPTMIGHDNETTRNRSPAIRVTRSSSAYGCWRRLLSGSRASSPLATPFRT